MSELSQLQYQVGALSTAVNTLTQEVTALRKEVADLTQARASVKFVLSLITAMVGVGAAISEIIHLFWGKP